MPPPIRFTPKELDQMARDYFLWELDVPSGSTIIDVGVGMGTELPTYSRLVGDSGHVYGFEAHPKSFRIASRLAEMNGLSNVTLTEAAIWNEKGVLQISDDPESLGINSLVEEKLLSASTLPVSAVTLDDWWRGSGVGDVFLLKLNIEGAEKKALDGAEMLLARTANVVVACHDFVANLEGGSAGMRTKDSVRQLLSAHGFTIMGRTNHEHPAIADTLYASRNQT